MSTTCHAYRWVTLTALGLTALTGCEGSSWGKKASPYDPALAPTMDRLIAAYPDLASRKIQLLADFEQPAQASLFTLRSPAGDRPVQVATERAQSQTGVGALKVIFDTPADRLIAADAPDAAWSLQRDWSDYHLLLFSVYSPRACDGLNFSIESGRQTPLRFQHPRIQIKPGWNLIRVDLGQAAEQVNLTDVRALQFWCDPLDASIVLYLDDLILTDNQQRVFGPTDPEDGDLYVDVRGRRLVAGSAGRYELVFHRGQIVQWFDLGSDPGRIHNLIGPGTLGPTPALLAGGPEPAIRLDDPDQWNHLGRDVASNQRVLEASTLFVTIEGEWQFDPSDRPPGESVSHRWQYTLYRDGRLYTSCNGSAGPPAAEQSDVAMVFAVDRDQGFQRTITEARSSRITDQPALPGHGLFARPDANACGLIVAAAGPMPIQAVQGNDTRRLAMCWRVPILNGRFNFAAMLRLWPHDLDTTEQAAALALDYARPWPIQVDVGQLVRTDPGDLDNDGYSEGTGRYVLQLAGSVAKIRLSGREHLRFSPTFKLLGVANREVWVYIDGRELKDAIRDRDGELIFSLPGIVSDEVLIEITSLGRGETAIP